ncbi:hypothetical protein D1AOALGA4SA_390 [Olavius algarvensis Delta 1 endosymbiont]|nr:hypothetical protein D1AOALGA4SA_390 [Olavius algarvensis Delta 1 endosymbiont]
MWPSTSSGETKSEILDFGSHIADRESNNAPHTLFLLPCPPPQPLIETYLPS